MLVGSKKFCDTLRTAENKKTDETTTPLSYMAIKVMIETGFKTNLLRGVR